MRYKTTATKDEMIKAIVDLFYQVHHECAENPSDRYYVGRDTAMLDLLQKIKIYDADDNE